MKWLRRILGGLLLAAVAVTLLFVFVTGTGPGGKWLGENVVRLAGKSLTFDLRIGSIRATGPYRWTLREVRGYEKGSDSEFFRAHRVDVSINWTAWLSSRRFDIVRARVDSLNATLWFDTTGVFHPVFPGADTTSKTAGPGKPLPLAIKELLVDQIAFSFEERGRDRTVKLYDAGLKGSGRGNEWNGSIDGWLSFRGHGQPKPLSGPVSLGADLAGGIVQMKQFLWTTSAGRIDGHGRWDLSNGDVTAHAAGVADLDTLSVVLPGADRLSGTAKYELDVTRGPKDLLGRLTLDLEGVRLDSLRVSGLSGILSARGQVSGPLTPPDSLTGQILFDVAQFQGPRGTHGTVSGRASIDHSLLDVSANGAGITLSVRGTVLGPRAPNVRFSSLVRDIDRFMGNRGLLEGDLRLTGVVEGTWASPDVRTDYRIPVLTSRGFTDRDVHGRVSFRDSTLMFDVATARGISGEGRASRPRTGPDSASAPWRGSLSLRAPGFPLADLKPLLPPDWLGWLPEGNAEVLADLNGTLAAPRGQVVILGRDLRLRNNDVGTLNLTADILSGEVRMSGRLTPARGRGLVLADIRLPLDTGGPYAALSAADPITADLVFDDLVFEATPTDSAAVDSIPRHVAVRGTAHLSMVPNRTETRRVALDLDTLVIRSDRARLSTEGPLRLSWRNGAFDLDSVHVAIWRNDPDTLTGRVAGSLHYDGRDVYTGGFRAGPVPLDLVYGLLPGFPELGGTIEATIVPSGRRGVFGLDGTVDWVDPSTADFSFDRIQSHFRYSGNTVTIDSLVATADTSSVSGSGTVQLGRNGEPAQVALDFETKNFGLGALPFPPASFRVLAGNLDGWVKVRGTSARLLYTGRFDLDDGAIQFGPMLAPVRGVTARFRLEESTVFVDSLKAAYDDGRGEMSGRVTFAPGDDYGYDLTGHADGLRLFLDPGMQVRLTGPVSLVGTTARSELSGDFRVTDGRYTEKFDIQRVLLRREIVAVRSERTQRLLDGMNLNLRLTADSDEFKVDNNVALIPMRLDLLVLGTVLDWRVAGTAEAEPDEGKFFYLDREFKVDQLNVTFDDPRRPDPRVDLTATTEVTADDPDAQDRETYDITLNYGGRASLFRPDLTSDPPLAQPDIVALLTLGVPVASLGIGSGTTGRAGDVFLTRARELTTRGILQVAGRRAAEFVGVSRVQVRPDAVAGQTALLVGKDFGKDVTVDASTKSLADPGLPRLEVNWRLTRRFSLRSIADQEGAESSLDFRYAFRFW